MSRPYHSVKRKLRTIRLCPCVKKLRTICPFPCVKRMRMNRPCPSVKRTRMSRLCLSVKKPRMNRLCLRGKRRARRSFPPLLRKRQPRRNSGTGFPQRLPPSGLFVKDSPGKALCPSVRGCCGRSHDPPAWGNPWKDLPCPFAKGNRGRTPLPENHRRISPRIFPDGTSL